MRKRIVEFAGRFRSPEEISGSRLKRKDFDTFGLREEQVEQLFAEDDSVHIIRRRRVHALGSSLDILSQHPSAVPPEYKHLFSEDSPLNAQLPETGASIMDAAFESAAELGLAEEEVKKLTFDVATMAHI